MVSHRFFYPVCWANFRKTCAGLFLLFALPASAQTLHLVTEEWPGLINDTPQGPSGVLWDISKDALESMGYEVTLEFVPWKRAQRLVLGNDRDGILGIGLTAERESRFNFPKRALLVSETAVHTKQEREFQYENPASLSGMKVGVSPGYKYSPEITESKQFERVNMPSIESGLKMLLLGRIDAMLANRHVVRVQAERMDIADRINASEKPVSGGLIYLAFSPETSAELLEAFSSALERACKLCL
ncbi:MAG TPA: transporter substrate-binding domain-containing protein [Marinobacter sp.]|uniref:Transporter substrate-binding domain-containing protein n=2 Tax=root TaxID=1 RepID=A0A831R3X6_9GAMM|nr:transporter substrate-binding domain-containing protein [Marinobacter antarcticus]HDZ36803.1 transporter substrate-binding domain-containing protein [Marinobacter sp.]HEA52403.1 transporter substrate-binding domain-containing protein [Marinobacter antarcticus]